MCDKCADNFNPADSIALTFPAIDGPRYCPECAFEEDISAALPTQSSLAQNVVYRGKTSVSHLEYQLVGELDNGVVEMEMDGPSISETQTSSKLDSVVRNLIQLDRARHHDSKPIKR